MSFFDRFQGVFFNPQQTFHFIAEKPVWKDALIVILIAWAAFTYVVTPFSQQDNIKFMEESIQLKERMGEERYNQALEQARNPSSTRKFVSLALSPVSLVLGLLFSSLILLVMGRLTSTEGKYIQVFAAYVHANLIDKILGNALRLLLIFMKKSVMQTTTSLALFVPNLEVTSPLYIVLSQVDFFQLWMFGIFAYGLSKIFKISIQKTLFISYGFWLLKSLLYIAMGLATMSFMR